MIRLPKETLGEIIFFGSLVGGLLGIGKNRPQGNENEGKKRTPRPSWNLVEKRSNSWRTYETKLEGSQKHNTPVGTKVGTLKIIKRPRENWTLQKKRQLEGNDKKRALPKKTASKETPKDKNTQTKNTKSAPGHLQGAGGRVAAGLRAGRGAGGARCALRSASADVTGRVLPITGPHWETGDGKPGAILGLPCRNTPGVSLRAQNKNGSMANHHLR